MAILSLNTFCERAIMTEYQQILTAARSIFGNEPLTTNEIECVRTILAKQRASIKPIQNVDKDKVFQVAAVLLEGTVLVVSHSVDSDRRQIEKLKPFEPRKLHPAYFNSSLKTPTAQAKVLERIKSHEFGIVYVAREEIDNPLFIDAVEKLNITLIATYDSAFPTSILKLLERLSTSPRTTVFASNAFPNPNIELRSRELDYGKNAIEIIKGFVIGNHGHETGIIYCLSNKSVDKVYSLLQRANINAVRYGGKDSSWDEKNEALELFNDDTEQCVLVTNLTLPTNMIHRDDIRFAIHHEPPKSLEEYRSQISFLGADGLPATSILIWSHYMLDEYQGMIESDNKIDNKTRLQKSKLLKELRSYCSTMRCLQCYLMDYFGTAQSNDMEPCGICTTCKKGYTYAAPKRRSVTAQHKQRKHIADTPQQRDSKAKIQTAIERETEKNANEQKQADAKAGAEPLRDFVESPESIIPEGTPSSSARKCSQCRYYGNEDHCNSLRVCDDFEAKTECPDYWPTLDDMAKGRFGDMVSRRNDFCF